LNHLVSIITPSYHSSQFISYAIESVLAQTYLNWELIVIDDSSPDNANEIVEGYIKNDDRIKLIKLQKNGGAANARNEGIKNAKGKYIAFLDSDDIWLPQKLEKQIQIMHANNLVLTYSSYYTIDEDGNKINMRSCPVSITLRDMYKSNHIGNLTGIYDSEQLGKYFFHNIGHEDYVMWLSIMEKIKQTKGINQPLAEYRILTNSLSANKIKALVWQWKIYREVLHFNVVKSLFYFLHYVYFAIKKRK